ncbi:cystathionine gamma-synthase [Cystobacter fuscus]|uniref:Cystathionine gamma-synthase n=1 Tax=Cystobacter fuscus TaxID=43 RepID=A0A250J7H7_9BACT|nr:hypothetical protein [Cystobacter fuscus]ATB39477.1 cystathionine gamma-synthase [Cystobacter fuscus]
MVTQCGDQGGVVRGRRGGVRRRGASAREAGGWRLGAVESIVTVPARHSHAFVPALQWRGITDGLIRYSV